MHQASCLEIYPSLAMVGLYTNKILISQMALPRDIPSAVYSGASGYSASVNNLAGVTIASDNVFGDNTSLRRWWRAWAMRRCSRMAGSSPPGWA